jgi:glycine/D-amino acid oxidase-like deaminating enzyme
MVGQGGTGIQTAPAAGELVAALVAGAADAPSAGSRDLGPARLR